MNKKRRRPPTLKERMTPCIICTHPLSEKHHILSFGKYGELEELKPVQFCANCHEMYHLFERYVKKVRRNDQLGLFAIETDEEKIIENFSSFSQYFPLFFLARSVCIIDELIHLKDRSPEQDKSIHSCLSFVLTFKEYVKKEQRKHLDQMKDFWQDLTMCVLPDNDAEEGETYE